MKGKKLTLLILGIVLFLIGLIWILMAQGFWLNWLILMIGIVLFVLSFIGKENADPVAPTAPKAPTEEPANTEAAPESPIADSDQSGGAEEAPREEN